MKSVSRLDGMPAYTPIEPLDVLSKRLGIPEDQIIKLDANENPYGPSPKAVEALTNLQNTHIYPDPESRNLRAGVEQYTNVPAKNLLMGAGADELIDLLLRIMLEPGDAVINLPPTFGMYAFGTRLNAGSLIEVPRKTDFSIDLEAVQQACEIYQPKIIFVTTPNNPSGNLPTRREIEVLLDLPSLIVLDEAYIEFCDNGGKFGEENSWIQHVPQRENLVVLRTFSKWAGLAGLRIGYAAFPDWLYPALWKAKQPYNVNVAADAAALASLNDLDHLSLIMEQLRSSRQWLYSQLQEIPYLQPYPSQTNFILCRVLSRCAQTLKQELEAKGILVRYYQNKYLEDMIRISVGQPQSLETLMYTLKETI
ncbi:MAG: histidinol-phosphate transaminase [Anaerolineaceae bacterium]|nr:histidinol-phosphate transaminase [Anaerolineaceae bacterium]